MEEEIVKIISKDVENHLSDRDDMHLFCIVVKGERDCENPKTSIITFGDTLTIAKGLTQVMHKDPYTACICTNAVCDYTLDRTQVRLLTEADVLDENDD